ncbi:hypothetical protein [Paraflavitalea speifideaquila]|uniref:hypothetical protein n=1 Tax=Paraflavitalea speifideaquila TaxID=3076558 RepID=UPI0028EC7F3B|nr:hypothetical protein [Paraflavitalea speifideiaquila]
MNRKLVLPAITLVIAGMLPTVIEATANTWLTPNRERMPDSIRELVDGSYNNPLPAGQATILNPHAFKAVNSLVKE